MIGMGVSVREFNISLTTTKSPLQMFDYVYVSISSTFYARLFHTKANCAAFSSYVLAVLFLAPKFCTKNACVKRS